MKLASSTSGLPKNKDIRKRMGVRSESEEERNSDHISHSVPLHCVEPSLDYNGQWKFKNSNVTAGWKRVGRVRVKKEQRSC
jgi:hypothetical protein